MTDDNCRKISGEAGCIGEDESIRARAKTIRKFRFCVWWSLLALVVVVINQFFPTIMPDGLSVPGVILASLSSIIGMAGSMTIFILFIGMLTHLMKVSGFSTRSKVVWIILFICFAPVSEAIYFFAVYNRSRAILTQTNQLN